MLKRRARRSSNQTVNRRPLQLRYAIRRPFTSFSPVVFPTLFIQVLPGPLQSPSFYHHPLLAALPTIITYLNEPLRIACAPSVYTITTPVLDQQPSPRYYAT
jgi:hypothetical protein